MILTDNLLGSFTVPFEHGLLVIEDSGTRARHGDWVPANNAVHVDEDSVYIAVQAFVDGPVTVEVYNNEAIGAVVDGLIALFADDLPVASGVLKISDSENLAVLSLRIAGGPVRLRAFVDDEQWSSRVVVIVG